MNCPLVGPGLVRGVPSGGIFLRHPIQIYVSFGEKHMKTSNGKVDKRDQELNSDISREPALSAEKLRHWWSHGK